MQEVSSGELRCGLYASATPGLEQGVSVFGLHVIHRDLTQGT